MPRRPIHFIPPWDIGVQPGSGDPERGGIVTAHQDVSGDLDNGSTINTTLFFAGGIYLRVRAWRLFASLEYDPGVEGAPTYTGVISLTVHAVRFPATTSAQLSSEREIALHGGWYGTEDQALWTDSNGEDVPVGAASLLLWPRFILPLVGELDCILPRPELTFELPGYGNISFGRNLSGSDDAPVVMTMPVTENGSFDDTTITSRLLALGTNEMGGGFGAGNGILTGSATLVPVSFWPWPDDNSSNPIYDFTTGAHLLNPRDFSA